MLASFIFVTMDRKGSSSSTTTPSVKAMRDFYAPWVTWDRHGRGTVKAGAAVKVSIPPAAAASSSSSSSSSRPIRRRGVAVGASLSGFPLPVRTARTVPTSPKEDYIGIAILSPAVTCASPTSSLSFSGGKEEVVHTSSLSQAVVNEGCHRHMPPPRQIHHFPSRSYFDGDDSVDSRKQGQRRWRKGLAPFDGILSKDNTATKPPRQQCSGKRIGTWPPHGSHRYPHHQLPPRPRLPWARRIVAAIKARPLIVTVAELGGAVSLLILLIVVIVWKTHHQQNDHDGRPQGADTTPTTTAMAGGTSDNTTTPSMKCTTTAISIFVKPERTHSLPTRVFSSR